MSADRLTNRQNLHADLSEADIKALLNYPDPEPPIAKPGDFHPYEPDWNEPSSSSPITPETLAAFNRMYRITTASLVNGDRDKVNALRKRARRIQRTTEARRG